MDRPYLVSGSCFAEGSFTFAYQAPIVRESCTACMFLAERDLLVIEVQFGTVAPGDEHRIVLSKKGRHNLYHKEVYTMIEIVVNISRVFKQF